MESKSRFTEQDQERLFLLPRAEVAAFSTRLAEITMRHQINEDTWEANHEKIEEDADKLFADIKTRLTVLEERGQ